MSIFKPASSFLANLESSTNRFKPQVDRLCQVSSQSVIALFTAANGIIGMIHAAGLKGADSVSLFTGIILTGLVEIMTQLLSVWFSPFMLSSCVCFALITALE